jgi:hypothetical protein
MKKTSLAAAVLVSLLSACHSPSDANLDNFTAAMNGYLATRGDLCLAKTDWPIDVTQHEVDTGARNAVQMPVLERIGLVSSVPATAQIHDEDRVGTVDVRRYTLTEAGKQFYRERGPGGRRDFCAAHLTLDKVIGWESPRSSTGAAMPQHAVVTYTYKVDPAPWARNPEVAKVFPMVDRVVRGAGSARLKEGFTLTNGRWVAQDS